MKIEELRRRDRRYLDMLSACQFLNKLHELEEKAGEDAEFYRNIRHFFHHTIVTTSQHYRYQAAQHAVFMWNTDAHNYAQNSHERDLFERLTKLAQEMLILREYPTGISTLITYSEEEKEYKLWDNQW
jgi:hypothetical protein